MKLIIYSMDDIAGSNIARMLIERCDFNQSGEAFDGLQTHKKGDILLVGSRKNVKDLKALPYQPEVCVVASRHKSESGKPTLTCHPTGNFGPADLGGEPGKLQMTDSNYLRQSLILLQKAREKHGLTHEVSREVTHHGPTGLPFPLLYVEVGSSEGQWKDEKACAAAASAIDELIGKPIENRPSAIGFGGPHYAPNFNKLTEDYAIGHIMPKHAIGNLTKAMVQEMISKTATATAAAIIDWKGLRSAERAILTGILEEIGLKWIKTSEIK